MFNEVSMRAISGITLIFLVLFSGIVTAETNHSKHLHSKYKGQEKRTIKSLSKDDIEQLENGSGWGLAKAAELNGIPGPIHIIEMATEIDLSDKQRDEIEALFDTMNSQAKVLGKQLIKLEANLNDSFRDKAIDQEKLTQYVQEIANVRAKLRLSHLSAHLETPKILTKKQIALYNELRGYDSNDPCMNIPKGHNEEMWKKHNGCS